MTRVWILTTDARISGLLEKVQGLDASVEAIVVAPWETADSVASAEGVDRVVLLETGETVPMQATTATLADLAARERPGLIVAGGSRMTRPCWQRRRQEPEPTSSPP